MVNLKLHTIWNKTFVQKFKKKTVKIKLPKIEGSLTYKIYLHFCYILHEWFHSVHLLKFN